jgi:hypothetical protein
MQFYLVASEVIVSANAAHKSLSEPVTGVKRPARSGCEALFAEDSGGLHFPRVRP